MLRKPNSEEGEPSYSPSNVEVPLSAEEAHVHLHLGVQVAHTHLGIKWLRPRFFFEKYQMTHNICTSYGYSQTLLHSI